jgi:hypothetical protein
MPNENADRAAKKARAVSSSRSPIDAGGRNGYSSVSESGIRSGTRSG